MHKLHLFVIALILIAVATPFTAFSPLSPLTISSDTPSKYKILIVPGHEPTTGGAIYLDRREREMVAVIGEKLEKLVGADNRFEATLTRNENTFQPLFKMYFESADRIMEWQGIKKAETIKKVESGELAEVEGIQHNSASQEASTYLYGINKWSGENDVDFIIHLHINDDVRKKRKIPGLYSGFSIYIPEKQYSNSKKSRELAEKVKEKLSEAYGASTLKAEADTIIEAQELIALGRYGTLDVPAILIEYGYIYENIFSEENFDKTATDMAERTYDALTSYLFP